MAAPAPQPSLGSIDISILERTAEDISSAASAAGSDIGSEIRKMMSAERERERERSRSRSASQSSSSHHNAAQLQSQSDPNNILTRPRRISSNRSRATSNSYANSVSDARLGITSPVESVRSAGSWSRGRMAMESSILLHSSAPFEPTHEPLQEGRPLDSPLAPSASVRSGASQYSSSYSQDQPMSRRVSQSSLAFSYSQEQQQGRMSRQASQSSFAMRYDQMASQIEEQLQTIPHTPEPDAREEVYRQGYEQQYQTEYHHQQEQGQPVEQQSRDLLDTPDRPHSTDTFQEAQLAFKDFDGVHFNPATEEFVAVDEQGNEVRRVSARTSSGSLLDAAQLLKTPRARPMSYGAGTVMSGFDNGPQEGMVYYPAPVPRMLNLPKRLSQQPAPSAQAKRRTQLLNYERDNHMISKEEPAPFIPKLDFDEGNNDTEETTRNRSASQPLPSSTTQDKDPQFRGLMNQQHQRRSTANMSSNLPPQLRASIYFEHQPIAQDVQIDRKHQSVVATLDSILAASATAPVSAFVDHPFAGDVRSSVYAMEKPTHTRKNTSTQLLESEAKALKKKRSSSIGNFFRRSSGDLLLEGEGGAKRPGSRGSGMLDGMSEAGGRKLQKRKSQLSMADAMERERTLQELEGIQTPEESQPGGLVGQAANTTVMPSEVEALTGEYASPVPDGTGKVYTDAEQIALDFAEQDALSDVSDTDPIFAQPATLLAELQVRKAQMKSRVKGHAVKYPNGMHSTLLQLDAVEQINKQKRAKQKIALAWEDPHQNSLEEEVNEEDDVPLGVLYPGEKGGQRRGGANGKVLGLMEMREMEDTEPLRRRAERLNPGRYPPRRPVQGVRRNSSSQMLMMSGALQENHAEGEGEDQLLEGETLGQRARRIKEREELDGAIVDVVPKPGDRPISTFSADVLSQFGGLDVKDASEVTGAAVGATTEGAGEDPVEETLGQRRARLQRERSASGEAAAAPSQQTERPVLRSTNSMANLLSSNPVGSRERARAWEERSQQGLLQVSAANQARQKAELRNTNMGRSSSMGFGGGGGAGEQRKSSAPGMTSFGGLMGGVQARPTAGAFVSTAGAGVGFASPTAGYGGQMGGQQVNPGAYYALAGGRGSLLPGQVPTAAGGGGGGGYSMGLPVMGMGGYVPQQQQMGMGMPMMGYPQQPQMGAGMPMGGYNAGMGMGAMGINGMELPLDPNQRAAIDRWRMGIGA